MATEKERTRVYFNEFGVIEVATGKKVKIEVNDNQNAGDDVTITMPATSGTLMLDSEATMTTLVQSGTTAFTGPDSMGTLAVAYQVHANGNLRTLSFDGGTLTADTPASFVHLSLIDANNRPTGDVIMPIYVRDNTPVSKLGLLLVNSSGTVLINTIDPTTLTSTNFSGAGTTGIVGGSVTWNVAI